MNALARYVVRVAAVWLLSAQGSLLSAQQYDPGIVLDPVQPGNINRIFSRERAAWERDTSTRRANSEPERLSWDQRAKRAFKVGDYSHAEIAWRHAVLDEPQNGVLAMRLGQAQFASGDFSAAAESIQMGMALTPPQQWGLIVKNYTDLYPNNLAFTTQLRALEKARKEKPDDPATRFLLGYQYLYLGFPKEAEAELKLAIQLEPKNPFSQDLMALAAGTPAATLKRAKSTGTPPARSPAGGAAVPSKMPSIPAQRPQINPPD